LRGIDLVRKAAGGWADREAPMKRRQFVAGLLSAVALGPALAEQSAKVHRVAIVDPSLPVAEQSKGECHRAFIDELHRLGHVEGQNFSIERYSGEGQALYYPALAREVVQRNPDVIIAISNPLALSFKAATTTIPIVAMTADPVALGIVQSVSRPGGNITGVSVDAGIDIWGKRLEILMEAVPRLSRVGFLATRVLWDGRYGAALRETAGKVGVSIIGPPLEPPFLEPEYRRVLAAMPQDSTEALIVSDLPDNLRNRQLLVELAEKGRLPTIYPNREFAEAGGLIAYGFDLQGLCRQAAHQTDLILQGRTAGEIPYYLSAKIPLTINLKTAKGLGITIPPSLLVLADEVIE
jgi:putative ABC transport system substrate-binding protein